MLHNYSLFTTYTLIIKREKPLCNNKLLFVHGAQTVFFPYRGPGAPFSRISSCFLVNMSIKPHKI